MRIRRVASVPGASGRPMRSNPGGTRAVCRLDADARSLVTDPFRALRRPRRRCEAKLPATVTMRMVAKAMVELEDAIPIEAVNDDFRTNLKKWRAEVEELGKGSDVKSMGGKLRRLRIGMLEESMGRWASDRPE